MGSRRDWCYISHNVGVEGYSHTCTPTGIFPNTHMYMLNYWSCMLFISFLLLLRPSDSLYILRMYVCGAMCDCICIFESICVSALIALTPTSVKWESPSICLKERAWESTVAETKWWIMQTSTQTTLLTLIGTVQVKYSSHYGTKSMTNCSCYALYLIEWSGCCDLAEKLLSKNTVWMSKFSLGSFPNLKATDSGKTIITSTRRTAFFFFLSCILL